MAQPNPNLCYLVITPDPRDPNSILMRNGVETFYIKFGDGDGASSYQRCNPDHAYSANTRAPAKMPVLDAQGQATGRHQAQFSYMTLDLQKEGTIIGPGKFLEWVHIKFTGAVADHQGTEWHELQLLNANNSAGLRQNLRRMLELFPDYERWEQDAWQDINDGMNQQTHEFENLVESTWNEYSIDQSGTRIPCLARFVR